MVPTLVDILMKEEHNLRFVVIIAVIIVAGRNMDRYLRSVVLYKHNTGTTEEVYNLFFELEFH